MIDLKALLATALISVGLMGGTASADTLDLLSGPGHVNDTTFTLSNAVITTDGMDIFAGVSSVPAGEFCGVTALNGGDCSTVSTVSFNDLVENLFFRTNVFQTGDTLTASIFSGATLLSSQLITSNMIVDFSAFTNISSLVLDASASTAAGFTYSDFSFDVVAPIPLPAGGLLLVGALGAIAVFKRRKGA